MKRILAGVTAALTLSIIPALAKTVHHAAAAANNNDPGSVIGVFAFMIGCAIAAGLIAKFLKCRNPIGWVIAGFFFNVFAVVAALIVPAKAKPLTAEQQQQTAARLADIQAGRLTPFIPNGVMPNAGEQFYWEQRAQYGQTYKQRVTQGASPAVYVPLGHGVRMRVGGWKGASQQVANFAWGPTGTVYVSNYRVLFKADNGEVAQAPYREIITYDAYPEGLSVNVSKIGIMQFKTGDECLGAVFLKMVQGPPKEELVPPQLT